MKIMPLILLVIVFNLSVISLSVAQPASSLSQSDNHFAVDLYSRLDSTTGNVFFSPYSLSSALSMTYDGARGETAQEMQAVLHLNANDISRRDEISAFIQEINATDKSYALSVANAIWAQKAYPFKDDYLNLVKTVYFGQARNLDFIADPESSRQTINEWVANQTNDRIHNLLPAGSIKSDTRLVLTDAVYFKGKWEIPFNKMLTKPDSFWLTPEQSVQVDMMEVQGKSFGYTENDEDQVLKLDYQGNDLSMVIILSRARDIQGLEKSLTEPILTQWQGRMVRQAVNVFLPKFKFDSNYQLKSVLSDMGMRLAFDQHDADFSGMAVLKPDERLYIDQVYHKAWIDTDEQGTEAAAATGVGMFRATDMPMAFPPKEFRADHPFIFLIQDNKTGHVLFMGRVADPRESN